MDTYHFLSKISTKLRNFLTILLFFTGFALQLSSRNILTGLPFIILCVVINFVRNFSIKPIRALRYEWKEVTPDRIDQVEKQCNRLKKISGGNWGCVVFVIIVILLIFIGLPVAEILSKTSDANFPIITIIIDSIIIFGGLGSSGRRSVWIPNYLDVKIPIIKRVLNHQTFSKDPNLKIIPYLEVGETKEGTFPNDARFLIKFKDAPQDFIGIQFQISINNVQGRSYPYCYCVIIARPEFGLFDKFKPIQLKGITIETEKSKDAEVIIIRQTTTRNSGYHTNIDAQDYILANSINIAKRLF